MKRTISVVVLAAAMPFLFLGCDVLDTILGVNVFKPFSQIDSSPDAIKKFSASELLVNISSPDFFDEVTSDPEKKDAVIAVVETAMDNNPITSQEYQDAAVLGAQIEIAASPAQSIVDNVAGLVSGLTDGTTVIDSPDDVITHLIPPAIQNDPVAFGAAINALIEANGYYTDLAAGLAAGGGNYVNPDAPAEDVAFVALITSAIALVDTKIPEDFTADNGTGSELGDYLFALVNDPLNTTAPDFGSENIANLLFPVGGTTDTLWAAAGFETTDITGLMGGGN